MLRTRTTKVITISVFPEFMKKVDQLAKEESRTRSEMWREVMRRYIADKELRRLQSYGASRTRKTKTKESEVQRTIDQYRLNRK